MAALSSSCRHHRNVLALQQDAVEHAEAYVRAHLDTPVTLSDLCRIVGLRERSLRNAFYSVRGMGPKRCMLSVRLEAVRRALSDVHTKSTTVTGVATGFGFYELGRFAATYREAFGEAPSETLRGSARHRIPEHGLLEKGHAHACTE
jgi:AraC family transcriptional regulator, ethanolamine operon transcriptional activator